MRMHGSQIARPATRLFRPSNRSRRHPDQEYRLDTASIVTALLHDVIEDTPVSREDIEGLFGAEVAELVEGVTKLSRLELTAEHTRQAENLRKFILAISKDVRVLMVKLADRLHNMRTLGFIPEQARRERIARETIDIYAPLARSIGCHRICTELEELAFRHLNPIARDAIVLRLEQLRERPGGGGRHRQRGNRHQAGGRGSAGAGLWPRKASLFDLAQAAAQIDRLLSAVRHLCLSRHQARHRGGLLSARWAVIHRAWPCVPERFKDFISTPKRNNYRSVHTTVVGPRGMRIEMQIRTEAMDRVAEDGVAAHWRYKDESYGFDAEAMEAAGGRDPLVNLRQLVQLLEHGGDAEDLLEHAKLEMFVDQVFVFTPKGRLISLPRGAMPLDFAYAVHSDVGDTTVGVKINGELRPLRMPLSNGDVVEVIRGATPTAHPEWRSLAITGRARSAIRRHIRQTEKEEFIRLGRASLDQTFERAGKARADLSLRPALDRFGVGTEDELFDAVGRGRVTPGQALESVFPGLNETQKASAAARRRIEDGVGARLYVRRRFDAWLGSR